MAAFVLVDTQNRRPLFTETNDQSRLWLKLDSKAVARGPVAGRQVETNGTSSKTATAALTPAQSTAVQGAVVR
jgi:hypothetical protein